MKPIRDAVTTYQTIRERIVALHDDLDEETLLDTLEGETELDEVIAAIVRSALLDEAKVEGLRQYLADLRERLERLKQRARHQREIAKDAMLEVGLKRVAAPDFTLSIRQGSPALVVVDEGAIPVSYWKPQDPKLDRLALLADVKLGRPVPGITLSNPEPVMSVRVK